MMLKIKSLAVLTCATAFSAAVVANMTPTMTTSTSSVLSPAFQKGETLIKNLTQGQLNVTDTFTPEGVDLQGYVVKQQGGGQSQIIFSKDGKYLFIGNVITANGENITEKYQQRLIQSKIAKAAYQEIAKLHTITEGKDSAKHKLYIIIDPNCIYCHLMYEEIVKSKVIENGDLQIKWLPAGFLRADSAGKAAAMLTAKNPLQALRKDENAFNIAKEQGGLQALNPLSTNVETQTAFANVEANTEFFTNNGFGGTPTLLYKTKDGKYDSLAGFVKDKQFTDLVNTLSATW
jgi:thiol:disulfide interchange protein DsbG